jgi:DNA-binding IclR family transcriptional regulator
MATESKHGESSRALSTDVNDAEEETRGDESQDRHFVTALARGLEVLSCFRSGDSFLANHEIAMRCGLPKSTVTRLTYTLTKLGYLHLVPDSGRYRLGTATAALGSSMLVNLDVRQVARPYLKSLAAETGAVVALTTRDRLSMLYLECCRSTSIVTLSLDVGSRIPLGTSASGMALLAALPASERAELMERIRDLDEGNWPHTERGVLKAIEEYRATGCVTSAGNWIREVHGIATPLWPGRGLPLMAISVAGAAGYFPVARLHDEIRPKLLDTIREIERNLGQRPETPVHERLPMP